MKKYRGKKKNEQDINNKQSMGKPVCLQKQQQQSNKSKGQQFPKTEKEQQKEKEKKTQQIHQAKLPQNAKQICFSIHKMTNIQLKK